MSDDERTAHLVGLRSRQEAMDAARPSAPPADSECPLDHTPNAMTIAALEADVEPFDMDELRADRGAPAEGPTEGIRVMLEGLLAQTEAELAQANSERMKSYQTGAKAALLAALNFELLRAPRAPSQEVGRDAQ